MTDFGSRVAEERERLGLSRRGLSMAAGLDPTHARKFEAGETMPTTAGAESVAKALGLELVDLLLDGPQLFEIEFRLVGDDLPPSPALERMALAAMPGRLAGRVAVWPWSGDGCLRLRARASCLPSLVALAGAPVQGITDCLPRPTVWAVEASSELTVIVRAPGTIAAQRAVLAQTSSLDICPPVVIRHRGPSLWLARLSSVPARCSIALQRLAPDSPVGMFVPG